MSAKAFDHKTAAFLGFVIQNMPEMDDATMNGWMDDPAATKTLLSGFGPPEVASVSARVETRKLLESVATTQLGAVAAKKTIQCFVGSVWARGGRDSDFDRWLPANQPKTDACAITTLASTEDATFVKWFAPILGVSADTPVKEIGELLIARGHTMTLAQAEEMAEKTERGEKTGMRTDGWGNFFPVKTGDKNNPVSVGYVFRGGRDWRSGVGRLGYSRVWDAGSRILVRNLDASKL